MAGLLLFYYYFLRVFSFEDELPVDFELDLEVPLLLVVAEPDFTLEAELLEGAVAAFSDPRLLLPETVDLREGEGVDSDLITGLLVFVFTF